MLVVGFLKNVDGVPQSKGSGSLLIHLLGVEFELLTLKDVAVGATDLARAGGNAG